jgi:anti-anti-sigma regulatory factor
MLKIRQVVESGTVRLIVRGRIGAGDLPDLRELIRVEHPADVVLDLAEVNLVDAAAVRFLLQCEAHGIRVAQCPAYIREWMAHESGAHH